MKKAMLLGAGLALLMVNPAAADIDKNNRIFEDAKVECQLMFKSDKKADEYLEGYFTRKNYDKEEKILFVNYCLMYGYGSRGSSQ